MSQGWIKLHRKIQNNSLWLSETFTRGQAWVDLLLLANHKDGFFYKRGVKVNVERGQVGVSEVGLSDRWKWSRNKVRKFLKDLEKEQQIELHKSNVTQLVTIINYKEYQQKEQQIEQQKDNRRTAEGQQKDTNKNVNNDDTDKKFIYDEISVKFEMFRKKYPGTKGGLKTELDNFLKKNEPEIIDQLLPALEKEISHKEQLQKAEEFCPPWKHLSTWINKKNWEQEFPENISINIINKNGKRKKGINEGDITSSSGYN